MLTDRLEVFGRTTQLFYAWLIQYDLVTDENRLLVHSVLGTAIWRLCYQVTGRTPDELVLDDVFGMAARLIYCTDPHTTIPLPSFHRDWQPFVLDENAF